MPTIASRCVVKNFGGLQENSTHPLLAFFYPHARLSEPFEFEQTLKKSALGNIESADLAHQLCAAFITEKNNAMRGKQVLEASRNNYISNTIELLQKELLTPPAQGAGDLFWKNLYLKFPHEQ